MLEQIVHDISTTENRYDGEIHVWIKRATCFLKLEKWVALGHNMLEQIILEMLDNRSRQNAGNHAGFKGVRKGAPYLCGHHHHILLHACHACGLVNHGGAVALTCEQRDDACILVPQPSPVSQFRPC